MKIALIGYGRMGKTIEKIALQRGHSITEIIDIKDKSKINQDLKNLCDIAIDFSNPKACKENIIACLENGISVVSGTTGWEFTESEFIELTNKTSTAFFYASNFSIGMNIFMEINKKLANLLNDFQDYEVKIEETHHIHKLDKPSGTAINLAKDILKNNSKYLNWELLPKQDKHSFEIEAFREDEVFGDHKVIWKNNIDNIEISHSAFNRLGFGIGAVLAAEFISGKTGYFTMKNLLNL
jgi:4-hydroxy-tetrahydrodipicolinate reductase